MKKVGNGSTCPDYWLEGVERTDVGSEIGVPTSAALDVDALLSRIWAVGREDEAVLELESNSAWILALVRVQQAESERDRRDSPPARSNVVPLGKP